MGYACPVCAEPQLDADHLADHLAFQALTHGDDHESWLDEHVPGWAAGGTDDLAPRVADLAAETEYEVAFEDTTDHGHDHAHGDEVYDPDLQGEPRDGHGSEPARAHGHGPGQATTGVGSGSADLDPEAREIVQNARELTREMLTAADAGADESETETDGDETTDDTSTDADGSDG